MAEQEHTQEATAAAPAKQEGVRVYEVGYHIISTVKEDEVEQVVNKIRTAIEEMGGSLIAEGAPQSLALAYPMYVSEGGKNTGFDRTYFGWIKFEGKTDEIHALRDTLRANEQVLRFIIFQTTREETRASVKQSVLREVKRTDTIQSTTRTSSEKDKGEVSDESINKAIEEMVS